MISDPIMRVSSMLTLVAVFILLLHSCGSGSRKEQRPPVGLASVRLMEDANHDLGIGDVPNGLWKDVFNGSEQTIVNLPLLSKSRWWIEVKLDRPAEDSMFLVIAQPMLPDVQFYYRQGTNDWTSFRSGYRQRMEDKVLGSRNQVFELPRGSTEVYLSLPAVTFPLPLSVTTLSDYVYTSTWGTFLYGICLGLLIFVIINNLFLAISLRQWTYLHYVILVFGYATFIAITEGYFLYIFPGMNLLDAYLWNPILTMLIGISYGIIFLEVARYGRRAYRILVGVFVYVGVYIVVCNFLPRVWVFPVSQLNSLLIITSLTAAGIFTGYRGNRLGYPFAAAYLIFLFAAGLEIIYINTGSPEYFFGISYISTGMLIEAVILAFLLSKRFEWERLGSEAERLQVQQQLLVTTKENERIVRDQNALLEEQIRQRTLQLNQKNETLEKSLHELRLTQAKLIENEKLASLGQLTAGVAHEINNPVNFISNGVLSLQENSLEIAGALRSFLALQPGGDESTNLHRLQEQNRRLRLEETLEDNDSLFRSISNGVDRTVGIIKSLRNFSRLDEGEFKEVDLNEGLESTLRILSSRIREKAEVEKDYGELPPVYCQAGKINQVFLNLINNALQSIDGRGVIRLTTRHLAERQQVTVSVADSGTGIPEEIRNRIFEPFFTTKPVGKGTGLGLSITYGIVREHNGSIDMKSEIGIGTTFLVTLPVNALNASPAPSKSSVK
ncbi:MAG: ATP-binding protein [Lewinella sp.]